MIDRRSLKSFRNIYNVRFFVCQCFKWEILLEIEHLQCRGREGNTDEGDAGSQDAMTTADDYGGR